MSESPTTADQSDLEALKEVGRAEVYKNGQLAAHLTRVGGGEVEFRYTSDWIRNAGPRVSTTLAVTAEPTITRGGAVPAFFAGLLPEGRRLTALRQGIKTSADDELSLLLGIGEDTIGDVQIVPEGHQPQQVGAGLEVASFDQTRFSDLLQAMGVRVDRVGLPGVQDKVSGAMVNLPVAEAGAQTLLKLNPPEFKFLVENEDFFLSAARQSGITTVDAHLVRDRDGAPGLAVSRFDRVAAGTRTSLAVEDGCQALGLHPAEKYHVRTEVLFARLSSLCEASIPAAADYLAQLAFAYVTGNGDAHAKNFSVLCDQHGRWQPTPAYDLPSTSFYGDTTMALFIDGRRDSNITGARFLALAAAIDLPERAARRILERIATSVDLWIDGVDTLPFDTGTLVKYKRVTANRQKMLRQS